MPLFGDRPGADECIGRISTFGKHRELRHSRRPPLVLGKSLTETFQLELEICPDPLTIRRQREMGMKVAQEFESCLEGGFGIAAPVKCLEFAENRRQSDHRMSSLNRENIARSLLQ